ncbi:MAG: zinc ABC transporter substrate-binding protein [Verrucomicrobiota bacterium]|nr:zinc ABC transporter substrate-binding protein [Verrucomicrobiota bacterium]
MKRLAMIFLPLVSLALPLPAAEKIRVSSFSTILTEIAQQVGGELVEVTSHIKPGVDPHEFEPTPEDLKTVSAAQLVLLSAKHMEGYVDKLEEASGGKATFLRVGDRFPSLKMTRPKSPEAAEEKKEPEPKKAGHDHGNEDPHWWHSIGNMKRATISIQDALIKLSGGHMRTFTANAARYMGKLDALQAWVRTEIAKLPKNKRKLVTSHDAFQYFAKDNGFAVYTVEGVSTTDQPSSKKVAELIQIIKAQRVKAIFAESLENPKVLEEVTKETGAVLGGQLYADGLGEGEASTYEGMVRHNVTTIVNALK